MTKKIKFAPSWCSPESGTQRLLDQFYIDQDLSGVEFVYDYSYDILFSCCYEKDIREPEPAKRYIFSMEPSWSGNQQRHNTNNPAIIYGQFKEMYSDPTQVIESPTFMFYGAGGEGWTYKNVIMRDHPKTKNISSVISTLKNSYRTPNCLYTERRGLVTAMLASNVEIDVYAWNPERYPKALPLPQKINGVSPYKFSVASENTSEKNYITEKFFDLVITDTIPIYYGPPNIKDIFPENGYFLMDIYDTDSVLNLLDEINGNADQLYATMLPELQKIKHRYLTEFNLLNKILELSNA